MGIIKRQSLKSSIVNYLGVGLGAIFFILIFPHIIGETYLGFIQFILGITLVFAQLVCVGTHNVLFRYFDEWKNSSKLKEFNSLSIIIILAAFAIFCFVFLLFKEPIINLFTKGKDSALIDNFYWIVLPLILIQSITYYFEVYSAMKLRVAVPTFLREVLNRILLISVVFLLAYHFVTDLQFVWLYMAIYMVSLSVLAFYAIRYFDFRLGRAKDFYQTNPKLNQQFSYGRSATTMSFLGNLHNFIDTIMIPAFMDLAALGIYGRPLILGQMIHVPYRSIANISSPIIMEAWGRNDVKKIADLNKKISVNLLLIGLFLFCLVVVNTDNFFMLLPQEYSVAKNILFIIAFGRLVDMSFGLNTEILFSSKYYRWTVYFTIIMVVVAIGLNIILIPAIGLAGAATAVATSLIIFNVLKAVFIFKKFKFHSFSKPYFPLIIIAAFTIGITYYLIPDIRIDSLDEQFNTPIASVFLNVLCKSIAATIIFLAPVLFMRINPDLNDFLRLIVSGKIFKGGHKMEEL